MRRICSVQIQPTEKIHVLDREDYTAPTRQHDLWILPIKNLSALKDLDQYSVYLCSLKDLAHQVDIDDLSG